MAGRGDLVHAVERHLLEVGMMWRLPEILGRSRCGGLNVLGVVWSIFFGGTVFLIHNFARRCEGLCNEEVYFIIYACIDYYSGI